MLKEELHACFHGNVQGIGFRASAKQYADQLHVHGFVRNLPDGTVEICAQGYRKELQQLLESLQKEFGNYIEHSHFEYRAIKSPYQDFQIVHHSLRK